MLGAVVPVLATFENTAWAVFILRALTQVAGAVYSKPVMDWGAGVARMVQ